MVVRLGWRPLAMGPSRAQERERAAARAAAEAKRAEAERWGDLSRRASTMPAVILR
jgi:hypothetical protein